MNQRLYEIDVCRAIATFSVVATHAFAPYSGGWAIPAPDIFLYKCIGLFTNVFNLCLFVFISGYVFSFQDQIKPELSYREIIIKKIYRLIIPCLLWGGVYVYLFNLNITNPKGVFNYFSGVGHLWFLPMLFWVFVFFCPFKRSNYGFTALLPLFLLSLVTPNISSLGILSAMYYLIWFALGFFIYRIKEKLMTASSIYLLLLFVSLVVLFMAYVLGMPYLNELRTNGLIHKQVFQVLEHSILLPIAISGISFVYLFSMRIKEHVYSRDKNTFLRSAIGLLSKYSMGIYIFHDFIIELLYKKTNILMTLHFVTPWLAFLLALVVSLTLTKAVSLIPYLRKTI